MAGKELPRTSELIEYGSDCERGKVGYAHWRSTKKRHTHRVHRRTQNKLSIDEGLEEFALEIG